MTRPGRRSVRSEVSRRVSNSSWFPVSYRVNSMSSDIEPMNLLLGDDQPGGVVAATPDQTPELKFDWQVGPLANVSLTGTAGNFGPYVVAGDTANVTDVLPFGTYSVPGVSGSVIIAPAGESGIDNFGVAAIGGSGVALIN